MAIYKRGEVYWYEFNWRGKQIRASARTGNKRLAEQVQAAHKARLVRIEAGLEDATPAKPSPVFPAAMKAFLHWARTSSASKSSTAERYKTSSIALLEFFGKSTLDLIDAARVEAFIEWRRRQKVKAPALVRRRNPKATIDKPIKPATINRELACLRALFNYHIKHGHKIENPVRNLKFLAENEDTFHILTAEEEALYLAACSQPLHDVAVLILETGMRPEEVFRMRWADLDFEQAVYRNPHGKTKSARRRIDLSTRALDLLRERREEIDGPYVFPSPKKSGASLVTVHNAHIGAIRRAQLPRFRLYDLRHTFATRILESGAVDAITLMHMLGHRRLDMVLRYAHPSEEHRRQAIRRFEEIRNKKADLSAGQQNSSFGRNQ